jgi:hypothetical protein
MGELARRGNHVAVSRSTARALNNLHDATLEQLGTVRAIQTATEQTMFSALSVKRMQTEMELAFPAASEMLTLIANQGYYAMIQSLNRFGNDLTS